MADSLKTMKYELLRPKDWVAPTVFDSEQKFAKLSTMDISIIRATHFNMLVQQIFHAKSIEIFSILIYDIEKALTPKSNINLVKKLPTEYHDYLNVFS